MPWTIKCIRCGNDFEQLKNERTCGCGKKKSRQKFNRPSPSNHREFWTFFNSHKRHFQDAKYQYRKLTGETLGYGRPSNKRLANIKQH